MIKSKSDYLYYLEADSIALGRKKKNVLEEIIKSYLWPDDIWMFQKSLRRVEYYKNCKKSLLSKMRYVFIKRDFLKLSCKLGFTIPENVFGPGLSIAHYGTIIVNNGTKVGANCRLHACVNIGTAAGYSDRAPRIGDNCYIGPGAKIYGDIEIANNVAIGANSVVNRSFTEQGIAIAGCPAKKISDNYDVKKILIPATEILDGKVK